MNESLIQDTSLVREDDTNQVVKFVLRRAREWKHTDIRGLVIVNHQRNLPPDSREHRYAFTDAQASDAVEHEVGLVTTWQIFRWIRAIERFDWPTMAVQDLFYLNGRLPDVPTNYHEIGEVVHRYEKPNVISVELTANLSTGETIGWLKNDIRECKILSMQIESNTVEQARAGEKVGIQIDTSINVKTIPEGTRIYARRDSPFGTAT